MELYKYNSVRSIFLAICVGLISDVTAQWVIDDDGCRTPSRGVGSCIAIRSCKPMIDFLEQQAQGLSQNAIDTLQRYQCGFEGSQPKVCCPDGPISIGKPRIPGPPDISQHRNLNLLPSDCGISNAKERIIGGNRTALYEFPWMALVSYETGNGPDFRCGGSIISNRYILTAAHCVTNLKSLRLLGVRLGEYNISSPTDCEVVSKAGTLDCAPPVQDIAIEKAIAHPQYDPVLYSNDIGLIRLASPINISVESVQPICLPVIESLSKKDHSSTRLIVTGWGVTETGRRSQDLLKVEVPVIPEETCLKAYEKASVNINYKQLCAGGKNRMDSCGGDSGGPLQYAEAFNNDLRTVQHGIVSFGPKPCGREGFPGVYTRTSFYMDWILDNLEP